MGVSSFDPPPPPPPLPSIKDVSMFHVPTHAALAWHVARTFREEWLRDVHREVRRRLISRRKGFPIWAPRCMSRGAGGAARVPVGPGGDAGRALVSSLGETRRFAVSDDLLDG